MIAISFAAVGNMADTRRSTLERHTTSPPHGQTSKAARLLLMPQNKLTEKILDILWIDLLEKEICTANGTIFGQCWQTIYIYNVQEVMLSSFESWCGLLTKGVSVGPSLWTLSQL